MHKYEVFIQDRQGTPYLSAKETCSRNLTLRQSLPIDYFTPLSLRVGNVLNGNIVSISPGNSPNVFNPLQIRGMTGLHENPVGFLRIFALRAAFRVYQLISFKEKITQERDEIPEGYSVEKENIEFIYGNNDKAFIIPLERLAPIGKLLISRARHATQLQNDLTKRLSLGLRQRKNLEIEGVPEENAFIQAGEFIETEERYTEILLLSGHLKQ